MNVLVDTSVWSLSLQRRRDELNLEELAIVKSLLGVIEKSNARMLGLVRHELLSGIKSAEQFEKLRKILEPFPDVEITTNDYVQAARLGNLCRSKGVPVVPVDMLLCAAAKERGWEVFSTAPNFGLYSRILAVKLFEQRFQQ